MLLVGYMGARAAIKGKWEGGGGGKNPDAPFLHSQTHTERADQKGNTGDKKKQQQGDVSHSCAQGKIRFDTGRTMHIISIIPVLYYTIPYHLFVCP
ncbi:hypothetical protein DM02DRAFT_28132 [Periconia macrospinosa]|uniref:Uncharacterized protein n=1 Tax=Periconia macrospinosa TaxID=97972 RepID=A0A2V1DKS9_9PLEO|nr:hypothetical protein DM02DRAFT_28132 [Periconia macrospinosa]